MSQKNNRNLDNNELQNRFTAYLKQAIHNKRIDYLYKRHPTSHIELFIEDIESLPEETEDFQQKIAEYDLLQQAINHIKEHERYILLARVVEEKDFAQIAKEVGLSYMATTTIYYRTLKKLRKILEVEYDEF